MKVVIAALTIVVMILVLVPLACQYMEEPYRYYETYTRDLHGGLWVPDIFPRDIKQIHEQHDIDTNQVWLRFTLGDQQIDLSQFNPIERDMTKVRKPIMAAWWFGDLPDHYGFYEGTCTIDASSTLAISTESKVAYWWCK